MQAFWVQSSFSGGEWSPSMWGRIGTERYGQALRKCRNYIPLVQGALVHRPGTRYVTATKNNGYVNLIEFSYSTSASYMLEVGDQYIRFLYDRAPLTVGTVTPYSGATAYTPGDLVSQSGTNYYCIKAVTGTAPPNTTYWYALTGNILEVPTSYTLSEIDDIGYVQSDTVLYLCHQNHPPAKLQRVTDTKWVLSNLDLLDGPYLNTNVTTTTLSLSAISGSVTVTASAVTGINNDTGFAVTDIGRLIRFQSGTNWGWMVITGYTSPTVVTATIRSSPSAATASTNWRLGLYGGTNGYPSICTFHEDRLFLSGCPAYPQRLDGSVSSDYENFAPTDATGTVAASNALGFRLNSRTSNGIRWMQSDEKGLIVGTAGSEWVVRPSTLGEALSSTNINAKQFTDYGSTKGASARVGRAVLFATKDGTHVRECSYSYQVDGFTSPEVSVTSDHLLQNGIVRMTSQKAPQTLIWLTDTEGNLLSITYLKEIDQFIVSWAPHDVGGSFGSGNAVVEAIRVVGSPDGTTDDLWLVVKRTINGSTVRYLEYLTELWRPGFDPAAMPFMDSSGEYNGAPTTTVTGLTWLEGQTVQVVGDGAAYPDAVVSGGSITLDEEASRIQVGLYREAVAQTMAIEVGGNGPSAVRLKRINRVLFRFVDTNALELYSYVDTAWEYVPMSFRSTNDPMDTAIPPYTGDMMWSFEGKIDFDGFVQWRQKLPLPSYITLLGATLEVSDAN